ncbi:hypothetical protein [Streptomyces sp. MST-110588]|uniref:hypothetical protein n=1 Tax=Streptomyces sp. MST-110588 TaxID=2833628 RepID=UPI001F5DF522|nr:hypothetical protein [Streptomyces sp. MST-110588]UNO42438.1 hypothetical protein KGS77_26570 [Streptomyces sp. MST-110588]
MTEHSALTVASQARAIHALAALADAFPALPADHFTVGTVCGPDGIAEGIHIDLHACAADFEAWRQALGIASDRIEHDVLDTIQTLRAYATADGVPVKLTAYLPQIYLPAA